MRGWIWIAVFALIGFAGLMGWRDYQTWLALGPSGVSADYRGWATIMQRGLLEGHDGLDTARYDKTIAERKECAFLGGYLPRREGARPNVGHWALPHRQLDQLATPDMKERAGALFSNVAGQNPETLALKPSALDVGSEALVLTTRDGREVGHFHAFDGSMHMTLGAADAATIIEAGWGQAHPLAGRAPYPDGYVMIYAPRDERALSLAARILSAAIGHAGAYGCVNLSAGER